MIYQGQAITCQLAKESGVAELQFNAQENSVNTLDVNCLNEFKAAIEAIAASSEVKGLILSSAKDTFIVGADIMEFIALFNAPEAELVEGIRNSNYLFRALEDLPIPTVSAINGMALGGGFEMVLATDYRVGSVKAQVGLPETKLGIIPGFGGTVRLPRVIGADNAIEWIASGKTHKAESALKNGALDAVVAEDQLLKAAHDLLQRAITGEMDWRAKRQEKLDPLQLSPVDAMLVFEVAKAFIKGKAGPHYPAPVEAVKVMQRAAFEKRDKAIEIEIKAFVKLAKSTTASNLIGLFMNDQALKKKVKKIKGQSRTIQSAAVIGAGIMGGGIAYQSASRQVPIVMKDINEAALSLGLNEVSKLLGKQIKRGRLDEAGMTAVLNRIRATRSYQDVQEADIVVEAVVEKTAVKLQVLAEIENLLNPEATLCSNTSTISIDTLAAGLQRPENFLGMHFFNPVHRMPLVEVIRGSKTSDAAVATTVAYASALGKSPIVVNNCPGFFINRVLFPYFAGFSMLLRDGGDFVKIDQVMEKYGWPMGPAYLLDVVGIDTAHHCEDVLAEGFPDRMAKAATKSALDLLFEAQRYGQKNGKGFYCYLPDKKGKPKKQIDPDVLPLIKSAVASPEAFSGEEIVERVMIPMVIETVRCLEENIVASAGEADMGLIYGIGFPPFKGGVFRLLDEQGLAAFCEKADQYQALGKLYQPTAKMREMATQGTRYYPSQQSHQGEQL